MDRAVILDRNEQRAGVDTAVVRVVEADDRERAAEAASLRAGIDADDEDLAELRIAPVRVVDLDPVEAGEALRVERQEEERGIEPGLVHATAQGFLGPAALFGVIRERAVVHVEPCALV